MLPLVVADATEPLDPFQKLALHVLRQLILDYYSSDPCLRAQATEFINSADLDWLAEGNGMTGEWLRRRITENLIDPADLKWSRLTPRNGESSERAQAGAARRSHLHESM